MKKHHIIVTAPRRNLLNCRRDHDNGKDRNLKHFFMINLFLSIILAFVPGIGKAHLSLTSDTTTVAYWHFDETSGSNVVDSSSHANNGTAVGTSIIVGHSGKARYFDGANDYVAVSNPPDGSLNFTPEQSFIIDAWFKTTAAEGNILRRGLASLPGYMIAMGSGHVVAIIGSYNGGNSSDTLLVITSANLFNDDVWHHVTLARDHNVKKIFLYIDGVEASSPIDDNFMVPIVNDHPLTFGRWENSSLPGYFQGSIDEVQIRKIVQAEPEPTITKITDIPNDQGKQVRVVWSRSVYDGIDNSLQATEYNLWRRVDGLTENAVLSKFSEGQIFETKGRMFLYSNSELWDFIARIPAVQFTQYAYVAPTLFDSTIVQGLSWSIFKVSAHMSSGEFFFSAADSGYSVDNLAPIPPAGLVAVVEAGPQVQLTWNTPTDPDVGHYDVYRSTISGFIPTIGLRVGTVSTTGYTDVTPNPGIINYYRIVAVDIHDNQSQPSIEKSAPVTITQSFSLKNSWNMISIPLTLSDYTKTQLYPSAASSAFAFEGSYVAHATLQNGVGYWLKFNGDQSVPLTGLLRSRDTVNVNFGWNLIGSIGTPVFATNISSIPGGMVTSNFFGYSGSYSSADTIQPGKAYWVKVNQAGKLILSSSSAATPSSKIHIEAATDVPPKPPEGDILTATIEFPDVFSLEQNYPNPFNPATVITYALPAEEHVTLTIYNMLGQEVATLVNEIQSAGYKSALFNANNLPSGIYTYRLTAGTFTDTKRMMLVK